MWHWRHCSITEIRSRIPTEGQVPISIRPVGLYGVLESYYEESGI